MNNGEVQECGIERKAKSEQYLCEVVEFITTHLLDTHTGSPVAPDTVKTLLKQVNFKVMVNKNLHTSALFAISMLVKH